MKAMKHIDIDSYNVSLEAESQEICVLLKSIIDRGLPDAESKIWHGHPVWFLAGNPIVGYSKLKDSVQVLFWSGQSFEEPGLEVEGTFKAAQVRYQTSSEVDVNEFERWLKKARSIQWDYKNIVKRQGQLERIV